MTITIRDGLLKSLNEDGLIKPLKNDSELFDSPEQSYDIKYYNIHK